MARGRPATHEFDHPDLDPGTDSRRNARLIHEKVTDVFTSHGVQTLADIALDDDRTLSATAGHPAADGVANATPR